MRSWKQFLVYSLFVVLASALSMAGETRPDDDPGFASHAPTSRENPAGSGIDSAAYAMNSLDLAIDCATPSLMKTTLQLSGGEGRSDPVLRYILTRPSLRRESIFRTTEGNFSIHYTRDKGTIDAVPSRDDNKNDVPDYVETVGEALEETRKFSMDTLGYLNPSERFSPGIPYEVYILNLGGNATGATVPLASGPSLKKEKTPSYILIDNMILGDDTILKASAAHQYAHAITLAYALREESWWAEATAVWLEDRLFHTLPRYLDSLAFRLKSKDKAMNTDDARLSQGNALWAFFLGEKDVHLVRKIWEEMELFPETPLLDIFSRVIEREGFGSLQESFSDYALWSYFTGSRDDGNHFLFAEMLPDPDFASSYSCYPVVGVQVEAPLEPLGASFIRFESERTQGALVVNFDGDQGCRWDVDLLLVSEASPSCFRARMNIGPSGHGSIGIPWERVSEVIMIVKNLDCEEKSSGRYSYMASHDPSYPFELNFFNSSEEEGKIALLWETGSESNLFGWNIYRSTEPEQNFSRINEIFIPALGDSSTPIIYKFLDDSARRSVKYYYYIEGVTYEGLSGKSPVSSTRLKE